MKRCFKCKRKKFLFLFKKDSSTYQLKSSFGKAVLCRWCSIKRAFTRPLPPQQATATAKKPVSDADIPKVIKSIQSGATTLEALQQTREITAEQLVLINEGISNVEG